MLNILVTGAAGDIGRGISKILMNTPHISRVYGIDVNDNFPQQKYLNEFFLAPSVKSKDYLPYLNKIVTDFEIDLVIPTSEPELRYFNNSRIKEVNEIPLLMANFRAMDIGFDKLQTVKFLKESKLLFPQTEQITNENQLDLPYVIKKRSGSGSNDVFKVDDKFNLPLGIFDDKWIVQELLVPYDEEYTCGLFRASSGHIETIIFRRALTGGRTGYGEVVYKSEIDELLNKIAQKLNLVGSINIQLILTKEGPVVFEINPRFSSTVVFRHLLGFKDVEWSIAEKMNLKSDFSFDIKYAIGKRIFRADKEIIY